MLKYSPSIFLSEKICELGRALFYNCSTSVFTMHRSIINILKVDETGHVWFCVPAHGQLACELEQEFPSELQFFRKGKNFYLKISGNAFIISDSEVINNIKWLSDELRKEALIGKNILLKIKMRSAAYFEIRPEIKRKEFKNAVEKFFHNFFEPYNSEHNEYKILQMDNIA